MVKSKFLYNKFDIRAEETPPADAAKHVVTSVNEVNSGSADKTEPPINPNYPNHRIKTPAADRGIFDPGMAFGEPSELNFPILDPRK